MGFVFCSGCFKGTNSFSRFRKPVFKGVWFEQRIPEPAVSPVDRNAGGQSENRVPQGFRAAVFPIPSKMCAVGRHYGLILKYIHKTLFLRIQPGFLVYTTPPKKYPRRTIFSSDRIHSAVIFFRHRMRGTPGRLPRHPHISFRGWGGYLYYYSKI